MYNMVVHKGNCQWMLECFENYKYKFDTAAGIYSNKPMHDKHSHMMDTVRYVVQATKELEFFGERFFDTPGSASQQNVSYTEDWSGVWAST